MKPYTINAAPVVKGPLAGMDDWVIRAIGHSSGSLFNNGSYVLRDVKGKPGIISNHAKGLAVDLSYRNMQNGRKKSLAFMVKLLENADTLGIELVIDYSLNRSWKCDRATWKPGSFTAGDWWHVEINAPTANSRELAKQAWDKVFGVIPQIIKPI